MNRFLPLMSIAVLASTSYLAGCSSEDDASGGSGGGSVAGNGGTAGSGASSFGGSGNAGSGGTGNAGTGGTTGGTAGTGGTGGTPPIDTLLGRKCASDADCGTDFSCATTDDGIANGMCTKDCAATADCGEGGVCSIADGAAMGSCLLGCTWGDPAGPPGGQDLLYASKCQGRNDLGCFPDTDAAGDLDFDNALCLPLCRNDEECGPGFCSPLSGQCQADAPTGLGHGAACSCDDSNCSNDPCAAQCVGGWDFTAMVPSDGSCTQLCVNGDYLTAGACGSATSGPQDAACVAALGFGSQPRDQGPGDALGACAATCDCATDCANPTDSCYSVDAVFQQPAGTGLGQMFYGHDGFCFGAQAVQPGTEILPACGTGGSGGTGGTGGAGGSGGATGGTGGATGGSGGATGGTGGATGGTAGSAGGGGTGGAAGGTGGATGGTGGATAGSGGTP